MQESVKQKPARKTILVDEQDHNTLKRIALDRGMTLHALTREMIRREIDGLQGREG